MVWLSQLSPTLESEKAYMLQGDIFNVFDSRYRSWDNITVAWSSNRGLVNSLIGATRFLE